MKKVKVATKSKVPQSKLVAVNKVMKINTLFKIIARAKFGTIGYTRKDKDTIAIRIYSKDTNLSLLKMGMKNGSLWESCPDYLVIQVPISDANSAIGDAMQALAHMQIVYDSVKKK